MSLSPDEDSDLDSQESGEYDRKYDCPEPIFSPMLSQFLLGSNFRPQILDEIKEIHETVHHGFNYITQAFKNPNLYSCFRNLYSKWFEMNGERYRNYVCSKFKKCYDKLHARRVIYSFSPQSKLCYAFSIRRTETIFLTKLFMDASKNSRNSKRQIITHEITHLYGETVDYKFDETVSKYIRINSEYDSPVLNYEECIEFAAKDPFNAVENADNYGFFFDEFLNSDD